MSQARGLYQLQELELAIIKHAKRMKAINAQLQDNEEVKTLQAQFDDAQAALELAVKRVREMELQIEAVASKRQTAETRLYSGDVRNPKELQDMEMEINVLARRRAELDDQLLWLMMQREEAHQACGQREAALKEARGKQETAHQSLRKEKTQLTGKTEQLMDKRRLALKQISPDVLKTYSSLRTAKANRPVSVLKDKACGLCGIEQNSAIIASVSRGDHLTQCHHCGRILIRL